MHLYLCLFNLFQKKNTDVVRTLKENTWTRELKKKGINVFDTQEVIAEKKKVETDHDKVKVSKGINSLVSIFKNSRAHEETDFNTYQKSLKNRKKVKKKEELRYYATIFIFGFFKYFFLYFHIIINF